MIEEAEFNVTEFLPYLLNQAAEQTSLEFQEIYNCLLYTFDAADD